jgi:hypothetical protein
LDNATKNTVGYIDGIQDGTPDTDIFTSPSWGDFFYLGSKNDGTFFLNGIIQSVAIFNKAHNTNEVATVTNLLK